MRDAGTRIIHRPLEGTAQRFLAQISVRFQVAMFAENNEHCFTWIGEYPMLHEIEYPFGQVRREIRAEAETTFCGSVAQRAPVPCQPKFR
jgi:hypothetical protein